MRERTYFWTSIVLAVGICVAMVAMDLNDTDTQQRFMNRTLSPRDESYVSSAMSAYEVDQSNATNTYIRYASPTNTLIYIKRIFDDGTTIRIEKTVSQWTNRVAATYTPVNIK
jgi:hypothetical protein